MGVVEYFRNQRYDSAGRTGVVLQILILIDHLITALSYTYIGIGLLAADVGAGSFFFFTFLVLLFNLPYIALSILAFRSSAKRNRNGLNTFVCLQVVYWIVEIVAIFLLFILFFAAVIVLVDGVSREMPQRKRDGSGVDWDVNWPFFIGIFVFVLRIVQMVIALIQSSKLKHCEWSDDSTLAYYGAPPTFSSSGSESGSGEQMMEYVTLAPAGSSVNM